MKPTTSQIRLVSSPTATTGHDTPGHGCVAPLRAGIMTYEHRAGHGWVQHITHDCGCVTETHAIHHTPVTWRTRACPAAVLDHTDTANAGIDTTIGTPVPDTVTAGV